MVHHAREIAVAAQAILLNNIATQRGNLDRFMEIATRECVAVLKAIECLDGVLRYDGIVRYMAVIADSYCFVATMIPAIIHITHDVAIHARGWIVGEVRWTLGVEEGVSTDSHDSAEQPGQ